MLSTALLLKLWLKCLNHWETKGSLERRELDCQISGYDCRKGSTKVGIFYQTNWQIEFISHYVCKYGNFTIKCRILLQKETKQMRVGKIGQSNL